MTPDRIIVGGGGGRDGFVARVGADRTVDRGCQWVGSVHIAAWFGRDVAPAQLMYFWFEIGDEQSAEVAVDHRPDPYEMTRLIGPGAWRSEHDPASTDHEQQREDQPGGGAIAERSRVRHGASVAARRQR